MSFIWSLITASETFSPSISMHCLNGYFRLLLDKYQGLLPRFPLELASSIHQNYVVDFWSLSFSTGRTVECFMWGGIRLKSPCRQTSIWCLSIHLLKLELYCGGLLLHLDWRCLSCFFLHFSSDLAENTFDSTTKKILLPHLFILDSFLVFHYPYIFLGTISVTEPSSWFPCRWGVETCWMVTMDLGFFRALQSWDLPITEAALILKTAEFGG